MLRDARATMNDRVASRSGADDSRHASRVLGAQLVVLARATAAFALMILMLAGTVGPGPGTPAGLGGFTFAAALMITRVPALGLWIAGTVRTAA